MTTFTSISNALVAVGAKPFATTIQALRDNPIAIAEGDPTAPKLLLGALERLSPGPQIRARRDPEVTNATGTLVVVLSFAFIQKGTIRVTFEHNSPGGDGNSLVRRVRNNSTVTLATFVNAGANVSDFAAREVDCPVEAGDLLEVAFNTGAGTARIRNIRLQTNGESLWPGAQAIRLEGNTYA